MRDFQSLSGIYPPTKILHAHCQCRTPSYAHGLRHARKTPTTLSSISSELRQWNKTEPKRLSPWICGQCCAPAGLPWITMKPLSTAPASVHKLHRPQANYRKDKPNDNQPGVTFPGEATGRPKIIVADHRRCIPSFFATPFMVPTPCSYSRRICSNNSTLTLLFTAPYLPVPMTGPRYAVYQGVGQIRVSKWAKSEYRNQCSGCRGRRITSRERTGLRAMQR